MLHTTPCTWAHFSGPAATPHAITLLSPLPKLNQSEPPSTRPATSPSSLQLILTQGQGMTADVIKASNKQEVHCPMNFNELQEQLLMFITANEILANYNEVNNLSIDFCPLVKEVIFWLFPHGSPSNFLYEVSE
jgi:hypothetical protein